MTNSDGAVTRRGALSAVLAMVATALVWTIAPTPNPVSAAGEIIISTFYVPLFEDNAFAALDSVNNTTANQLSSTTSITVGATGAIVFYDHWEEGYETDPIVKTQTSTLIFGDGITTNGNAETYCVLPRCGGDALPAGAVLRFNNALTPTIVPAPLTIPRTAGVLAFDGRDKISSTEGLAVTHATWPTAIDALHSEMAAAFDTSRWGIDFNAPVGTDTPARGGVSSFSYSGVEVMAREANTRVQIDFNNDGDFSDVGVDIDEFRGEGETVYVNGLIKEGTRVLASKPVQVFMMTGVLGSNFENRSFQIFPTEGLVNDYVAPASTATASGTYATVLYLYNPTAAPLSVTVTRSGGSDTYVIPVGETYSPAPILPRNQAARVTSPPGTSFAAVAGVGTAQTGTSSKDYDWGYSLLPARVITDSLVVGWALGSQNNADHDSDPVWVTLLAPTTLFVDYDSDPTTGPNVDPNGSRYDIAYDVPTALTQLRITDDFDNEMTGAHLYTVDGVGVAAAYGEDPGEAELGFPGLDLGTTLFPACGALCVRKLATISIDIDGDGLVDPGDTLRWSVEAANTDYYALVNPRLLDVLPAGVTYVPGSTSMTVNAGPAVAVPDDLAPATLFPFDESGRVLVANLPVNGVVTATFETVVDPTFAGLTTICNRALVTSTRADILVAANGADSDCVPVEGLRITKVSNSGGNPLQPGQALAYTIVVTNQSSAAMTNVAVTDPVPPGLTWVSTNYPGAPTTTIVDNFETTGSWGGGTGWAAGAWTEVDGAGLGDGAGRIQKLSNLSNRRLRFLASAQVGEGISRVAGNLSGYAAVTLSFDKRCVGLEPDDAVEVQVRPNAAGAWTPVANYVGCGTEAAYVAQSFALSPATFGTATEIRFVVTQPFETNDVIHFDNVQLVASGVAGGVQPNPVTIPTLAANQSVTIVVNTTVKNPYIVTDPDEITNVATVRTGNQIARAEVTDCVRCFDYGDDPATYNSDGSVNPARARGISPRSYYSDTFQSLGYSGSTGTVPWAGASWGETDTGTAGGAAFGQVQNVIDGSTRAIRIGGTAATGTTNAFTRLVGDLSAFNTVTVGYEYRCSGLGTGDAVQLQIRPNAGAAWTTTVLQTFDSTNCDNATIYSNNQVTLAPASYGTATEIRLIVSQAFEGGETMLFDDIQIRATASSRTIGPRLGTAFDREVQGAGGQSPFPATVPNPPNGDVALENDEDGVDLPAVDTNTMVIPIEVSDASGGVSYVNGWLDWDKSGTFTAAESLFDASRFVSATPGLTVVSGTGQVAAPGTYDVTISVPNLETNSSNYAIGDTVYSRFRVATLLSGVALPTGPSADGEVEDYSTTLNTLPVNLAFFGSTRSRGKVTANWRTAQEVDNLGFNLYAQGADGARTLLTPDLVLSKAPTSIEAQEYSLTVATRATQIWLEDISLDGVSEMHGPYKVGSSVGDPQAPAEIDWAAARQQIDAKVATQQRLSTNRARVESTQRIASPATAPVGPVARLDVTLAGVQQVTYEQLLAAGIDLAGVDASSLAITDRAGPVQIEVVGATMFGPGSALRFIGQPLDTLYSGTNVYRVHIDPSLARRIAVVDPNPPATTTTTTTTTAPAPPTTSRPGRRTGADVTVETTATELAAQVGRGGRSTTTTTGPVSDTTTTVAPTTTTTTPVATDGTTTTSTTTTAPPVTPVTGYPETASVELNTRYSVTAPGDDPWFQRLLTSVNGRPATAIASITLTDPIPGQAAVAAVDLWGVTRDDVLDDHHVRMTVNGVVIADARFDDNDALRLQGTVPASALAAGLNSLQVTLVGDTGVYVDIVAVDSWHITYQRATVAVDGRLDLNATGARVDVSGMPAGDVLAYRVNTDGVVTTLAPVIVNGVAQVLGDAAPHRYVFSAASSVRTPTIAPTRASANLLGGSADYLIVTNGVLTSALAPLVASHQSLGRTVKVVEVADIYEAYSGGVVDAHAIDDYLAAAVPALDVTWVLLAGADSVDYRDYDGDGSFSLLPSLYGATGFGITYAPIDPAYADVDGDGTPDVALGRMPARTPAELTAMISKTLVYSNAQLDRSLLLVSDKNDGLDYAAINDTLAGRFDGWTVSRSDVDRQGVTAARLSLTDTLNSGVGVTMYLGHSSSQEWTEVGLFDVSSAQALTNAVPILVVQFGCWNTYYVSPASDTLAHALLLNTGGGAAAVVGATTLTSAGNDVQLAGFVADHLAAENSTIGEVLLAAKQDLHTYAGGMVDDVQLGFTILGDPALPAGGIA